jgi:hypothetical protein
LTNWESSLRKGHCSTGPADRATTWERPSSAVTHATRVSHGVQGFPVLHATLSACIHL